MNRNIKDYLLCKKNFLSEKTCEMYITELKKEAWKKHFWYSRGTDSMETPAGDNEPEVFEKNMFSKNIVKINDLIVKNLHSAITEYVKILNLDWFLGCDESSAIKFIRYFPGQTMQRHCDHIQSLFDGKRKGIPILSIIGLLNDDYEGGELIMFGDKKIDTKKGDLWIFPSNFLYPHEITPVIKGVRYSYVSWAW